MKSQLEQFGHHYFVLRHFFKNAENKGGVVYIHVTDPDSQSKE